MRSALRWIIALAVAAVLLAGAAIGGELVVRNTVPQRLAGEVRELLRLSDDHPVEVQLRGLVAAQVLGGALRDVNIRVVDAPITPDIRGELTLESAELPVRPAERPLGASTVTARFTQEQLGGVLRLLSRGIGQQLVIDGELLTVENTFAVFGQRIPLSISFMADVREGQVHIDPRRVDAGPLALTIDQLRNIPGLGDLALGFDVCVADQLPAGVTLESIELSTTRTVAIEARLDPHLITDPSLQEPGICD